MSATAGKADTVATEHPPGQCQYTVPRKKRLCRMTVRPGRRYCGEHDQVDLPADTSKETPEIDARIPCPLDPKHTCYASKLERHLKVCNARCDSTPVYISKDCNTGGGADDAECRTRLKDVPLDKLKAVIRLVEKLYSELVEESIVCRTESDEDPVHPAVLADYVLEERGRSTRRHLRQSSSLLHALEREGLVRERTCYVELGAGKGHVSYYLSRAVRDVPSTSVLLVDRASHRHKQDNKLDRSEHRVCRLRADISHLLLARVEAVEAADAVVAVSKHLCGVATDFALRCVTAPSALHKTRGVVMATCCHHRCTAAGYVARDFLEERGITREYFDIMMGVVSWATCGTGYSRERTIQESQQSGSKRQKVTADDEPQSTQQNETINTSDDAERRGGNQVEKDLKTEQELKFPMNGNTDEDLLDKNNGNSEESPIKRQSDASLSNDNADVTYLERLNLTVDKDVTDVKGLGLTVQRRTEIGRRAKLLLDYGRTLYLKGCGFDAKLCYYVDVDVSPENVCIVAKR